MKIKNLILSLSSIGLLPTATPIFSALTNQVTFTDLQNMQIESLDVGDKLIELKSINKSCEKLLTFDLSDEPAATLHKEISNIESRVKIEEEGFKNPAKEGKIERDDLFICNRIDTQYTSYFRYESNNIEKNNHTSWGNAKKYQLNVTVPANTKEYKVEVVADVKIRNCLVGGPSDWGYSFALAKLSQLSTSLEDTLMPYIGIKDENIYQYNGVCFKITTQNDLFRLFMNRGIFEDKPYGKRKLSSFITLSNETSEPIEIPIYFWYGFFGGGYTGEGRGSHVNCSEVTFSANHNDLLEPIDPTSSITPDLTTFTDPQNIQSLDIDNKLTEIKAVNKSCENLIAFNLNDSEEMPPIPKDISNIESRVKIEDSINNPAKEGKIERDDLFTFDRVDTQYTSYHRYKSNDIEKNNHTSWGNAKKYQLNVTVPANTKEYKVQVVADVKIRNCIKGKGGRDTASFALTKLSQLSIDPLETLMPYIGIKSNNIYSYYSEYFKFKTHNDLFRLFPNPTPFEQKPYEKATLSSTITLSNETPEDKEIPIYFWYGFFGGGYTGKGSGSHINCSEVTFSANHIE